MKCLCCGREIEKDSDEYSIKNQWHHKCIKDFFGTNVLPDLKITDDALTNLANKAVDNGYTMPGVQKKLSVHLSKGKEPRLTLIDYPCGYILKPQSDEYEFLPESEYLAMLMAKEAGITTVPFALIKISNGYAYITKRIDRIEKDGKIEKLPMEDFCQLNNRPTEDKYKGSYERCAKIISRFSSYKWLDLSEFYLRLVFCYIIGNSDMHLKNFSLISYQHPYSKYHLSPAYDLLPVQVVSEDVEDVALSLNGKKSKLTANDFISFGASIGIDKKACTKMVDGIIGEKEKFLTLCKESYLPEELKNKFSKLLSERIATFEKLFPNKRRENKK